MSKDQVKGHANEAKSEVMEVVSKVSGYKCTVYEGKADKYGGLNEARYGDFKSGADEATKSIKKETK